MILTIIQARLGSTRLPGKILLPIAGKPILQHVYEAVPEPKMVAMPTQDDALEISHLKGVVYWPPVFVNPNDVLSRFYNAWQDFKPEADWILRLTADCPMLTREIVEKFLNYFSSWHGDSLVWTIFTNRPWDVDGIDLELFSAKALQMAHEKATEPYDREHVTSWLYRHLRVERFSILGNEVGHPEPEPKLSIDTLEEYHFVKDLMEKCYEFPFDEDRTPNLCARA